MSTGLGAAAVDLQPAMQPATHQRDYTAAIYGSLLVTTLVALQSRLDAAVELIALSLVAFLLGVAIATFKLTALH
jgi:hypothetical protein